MLLWSGWKAVQFSFKNDMQLQKQPFSPFLRGRSMRKWGALRQGGTGGFSLMEVVATMLVIGLVSMGLYVSLTQINQSAVASRLYSDAGEMVADQITRSVTATPYNPSTNQLNPPAFPLLTASGVTPIASSTTVTSTVYLDPNASTAAMIASGTGGNLISGTMSITLTPTTKTFSWTNAGSSVSGTTTVLAVKVSLQYKFRNTNYTVSMDTVRSSD